MSKSETGPRLYTRKPTPPVEAVQWRGDNAHELEAFIEGWGKVGDSYIGDPSHLHVVGPMGWGWFLAVGDWLVRRDGTCDRFIRDEFEATYEPVEDGPEHDDPRFLVSDFVRELAGGDTGGGGGA